MTIHAPNIFAAPLVLIIWAIDCYVFASVIRLLLGRCRQAQASKAGLALQSVTDPIPQALRRWLSARRAAPAPPWLPWLIVFVTAVTVRHALAWAVFSFL